VVRRIGRTEHQGGIDSPPRRARRRPAKARGSARIVDDDGSLSFRRGAGLHVDLWDTEKRANAIVTSLEHEGPWSLSHARRLIKIEPGPLLAGLAIGAWLDPYRRRLDDLVVEPRLCGGDLDGARRALLHALAVFRDLGLTPELATVELTYRLGMTRQSASTRRWDS
jgi:hypothetical protein